MVHQKRWNTAILFKYYKKTLRDRLSMKKLLSSYPHLVKEWHPTKNGELTPNDFTHGSGKKVW